MRVGTVFSALTGSGPAAGRTAGPPGSARSAGSLDEILEAEIVQLSLHSDGIWQATAVSEADASFTQTSHRRAPFPPKLPAAGVRLYLPTGHLHVRTPTVGLQVDTYV